MLGISFIKILFLYPFVIYKFCVNPSGNDCLNNGWSVSNWVDTCAGVKYIGRFGERMQIKQTFFCPSGSYLRFSFTVGKFDSWDLHEKLYIYCDDVLIDSFKIDPSISSYLCFDPVYLDQIEKKSYTFQSPLEKSNFTIKFQDDFDESIINESWGMRNVTLEILMPCVDFFSECNYQGGLWRICAGNQTISTRKIPFSIKSIIIVNGVSVKMKDPNYFGGNVQPIKQVSQIVISIDISNFEYSYRNYNYKNLIMLLMFFIHLINSTKLNILNKTKCYIQYNLNNSATQWLSTIRVTTLQLHQIFQQEDFNSIMGELNKFVNLMGILIKQLVQLSSERLSHYQYQVHKIALQYPKQLFKLRGHSDIITSILLTNDQKENLIISAGYDKSIKFWYYNSIQNNNSWKLTQEIKDHQNIVWGLSMNPDSNTVISCGADKLILIIQFCQIWQVKQKIYLKERGFRIKFISNNFFIFSQLISNFWSYEANKYILIFSLQNDGNYIETSKFPVQGSGTACYSLFPSLFIPTNNLLIIKNGRKVNILKMIHSDNQGQQKIIFQIKRVLSFKTECIYGSTTQDGTYLAVYDSKQFQIQIISLEQM